MRVESLLEPPGRRIPFLAPGVRNAVYNVIFSKWSAQLYYHQVSVRDHRARGVEEAASKPGGEGETDGG